MTLASAAALMAAVLAAAGCGATNPAAPTGTLTGTWTGVLTRGSDSGPTEWRLSQNGAAITGTWSVDFAGSTHDASGAAGGTIIGAAVSLFLAPSAELDCGSGVTLSGTLSINGTAAGDRITGTYVTFTCDGVETGNVDVSR
jgi:hypothetical protein